MKPSNMTGTLFCPLLFIMSSIFLAFLNFSFFRIFLINKINKIIAAITNTATAIRTPASSVAVLLLSRAFEEALSFNAGNVYCCIDVEIIVFGALDSEIGLFGKFDGVIVVNDCGDVWKLGVTIVGGDRISKMSTTFDSPPLLFWPPPKNILFDADVPASQIRA